MLEDGGFFWIETGSEEVGGEFENLPGFFLRVELFSQGVKIGDEKVALIFARVLEVNEIFQGAEVVS